MMSELSAPAAPALCRHLRSKQYYMDLPFHASGMDSDVEVPCWCFRTLQMVGPDNGVAERTACTAGRTCYEAPQF